MAAELLLLFLVMSTFFIHFRPLQQSGQVICGYLWGQITKVVLGCTWNLAPETVPRELSCGSHVFGRECTPRASSNTLFSFSSMIQDLKISSKCFTSWRTSPWPVDVWWPLVLSYHRSASEALWNTAPGPDFVSTQWKKNITFSDQTHIESVFWASASAENQWRAANGISGLEVIFCTGFDEWSIASPVFGGSIKPPNHQSHKPAQFKQTCLGSSSTHHFIWKLVKEMVLPVPTGPTRIHATVCDGEI